MLGFKPNTTHVSIGQWLNIIGILLIPFAIFNFTLFHWVMCLVGYFLLQNFGLGAGYHKLATHKQYSPPNWFKVFSICICGTMAAQGPVIFWGGQHIAHHAGADTDQDPHSPVHKGFWKVVFFLPYLIDEVKPMHLRRFAADKIYRWQLNNYWMIMIVGVLLLLLIDPFSLIYLWLVPVGLARLTEMYLTAINHRHGYPKNNYFLGIMAGGEGWHKSHHDNSNRLVHHKHDWFDKMLSKL